ncbi:hypothetical protein KSF_108050 [Reticulibacter mediterranei]|uniref:Uncharacterized protein n=1 Tax=Reticulibacter mediterranei TaxID=2778369 RepID=A0A8J3NAT9_9CHLR|nr:hypothetical protein [Reticulibacter mediterranei]GHP00758.1 hypothetical protein KSF_108050 [Reticulibacter mediterranei]
MSIQNMFNGCIILSFIAVVLYELLVMRRDHEVEALFRQRLALHVLWSDVDRLYYELHGTSREIEEDVLAVCRIYGIPAPKLVLPEYNRVFLIELDAIGHALLLLGRQIDSARADHEDLEQFSYWFKELRSRFRKFSRDNGLQRCTVKRWLQEIADLHEEVGGYYQAQAVVLYQRFEGLFHFVEQLVDEDKLPAEEQRVFVAALAKQQVHLIVAFEYNGRGKRCTYCDDSECVWCERSYPRLEEVLAGLNLPV